MLGAIDPKLVISPKARVPGGIVNIFLKKGPHRLVEVLGKPQFHNQVFKRAPVIQEVEAVAPLGRLVTYLRMRFFS